MTKGSDNEFPKVIMEEVANDGSATVTPAADHRALFLGEDGLLHVKDSGGTVTDPYTGSGGTVDIEDEGAAEGAADTIDFVGAGVSVAFASGTATVTIPGGGSSDGVPVKPLDVRPATDHAKDDNFDDTTGQSGPSNGLDSKWTSPLSSGTDLGVTLLIQDHFLSMTPTTSGTSSTSKRMFGIRQAAPTGSFTLTAKTRMIQWNDTSNTDTGVGIFVARTADTKMHTIGKYSNSLGNDARAIASAGYSETADTGAYDGFFSDAVSMGGRQMWYVYRIIWDSGAGTLTFDWSDDQVNWVNLTTRSSQSQPDRIGICMYANDASIRANLVGTYEWFRVTEP
jgi:hypothetical protein